MFRNFEFQRAANRIGISLILVVLGTPLYADTVVLTPVKDNTIYSEANDLSNGAGMYTFAGKTAAGNVRRGLVAFNLSGNIPIGSTINSVTLQLYMSRTQAGNQTVRLHRLLDDAQLCNDSLKGLAAYDDPRTPAAILGKYSSFSTEDKRAALSTLAARPAYAKAMLDAVATKKIAARCVSVR